MLTGFLVITFFSALLIALRPLAPARALWIAIPVLLCANIVVTSGIQEMRGGLQLYWVLTSLIVMLAAIGVANLYVQGGLGLRLIAWFTLFLAIYDIVFTRFIPLTPELAVSLQGRPSIPASASPRGASTRMSASATCWSSASTPSPPTRASAAAARSPPSCSSSCSGRSPRA